MTKRKRVISKWKRLVDSTLIVMTTDNNGTKWTYTPLIERDEDTPSLLRFLPECITSIYS